LSQQPARAARLLAHSLAQLRDSTPAVVPAAHGLLARAQMAQGFDAAAEAELAAGIDAIERQRTSLRDVAQRFSFFDQAFPLFADMVRLQVQRRHDHVRALAFVERGRAVQLADSVATSALPSRDIEDLRRGLSEGVALLYYLPLADRMFAWAVTRSRISFIERSLPAAELSRLVAAHQVAMEGRYPLDVVHRTAARLHDELVRPLIPFLASQRALVFILDGMLQPIGLASLWDRDTGRYLIEDYILVEAPSGAAFLESSQDTSTRPAPLRALIVGNPH